MAEAQGGYTVAHPDDLGTRLVGYVGAVQDLEVLRALGFVQVLENPAVHPALDLWEPSFVLSLT